MDWSVVQFGEARVALYLNRRLWPFTALNSALTQLSETRIGTEPRVGTGQNAATLRRVWDVLCPEGAA